MLLKKYKGVPILWNTVYWHSKSRSPSSTAKLLILISLRAVLQMEEHLEREKKMRADVEKTRRKAEQDLKMTQEAVEELENVKRDLEDRGRK